MARDNFTVTGRKFVTDPCVKCSKIQPSLLCCGLRYTSMFSVSLCQDFAHYIHANTMPGYVSLCSLAACRPVSSVGQPPQAAAITPQLFHGGYKSCRRQSSSAFTCQTSTWICPSPCHRLSALCPVYCRSVLFPCLVGSSRRGAETKRWLRHDVMTSTGIMFDVVGKKTTSFVWG